MRTALLAGACGGLAVMALAYGLVVLQERRILRAMGKP